MIYEWTIQDRLIVSLDVDRFEKAQNVIDTLGDRVHFYKIGLEIFLLTEGKILHYLQSLGKRIFLDLKYYDIPNTVAQASLYPIQQKVDFFTLHASLGIKGLQAVAQQIDLYQSLTMGLGVSVLTSFEEKEFQETYQTQKTISEMVLHYADLIQLSGLKGIVCSAQEASFIKTKYPEMVTVCPGIRLIEDQVHDQKRVMTPYQAVKSGSDFLVMGRSILNISDPITRIDHVLNDIEKGLYDRNFA